MLHCIIKKSRKENTNICANTFFTNYDKNTLIILLISATDHIASAGVHSYLPLLPILYFFSLQQVLVLFLEEWPIPFISAGSVSFVFLPGSGYCSFPVTLITDMVGSRITLKDLLHARNNLSSLHWEEAIPFPLGNLVWEPIEPTVPDMPHSTVPLVKAHWSLWERAGERLTVKLLGFLFRSFLWETWLSFPSRSVH